MIRLPMTALLASTLVLMACSPGDAPLSEAQRQAAALRAEAEARERAVYEAAIHSWRAERLDRLTRPDGWLSLVGLHWLEPGRSFVGSGPTMGIRLAVGPEELGLLSLGRDGVPRFRPHPRAAVSFDGEPARGERILATDAQGGRPTVVGFHAGQASFIVVRRGDRLALRVRDVNAPSRIGFTGIDHFPIDPAFRFVARFEPHPPGQTLTLVNVLGVEEIRANPGALVFEKAGVGYRLEAVDEGDGRLFLVFADRTSGHESYAAARFLYAEPAGDDGYTMLDFNKAYNPPCAFTAYSTCPLPPPGNRLDLRIEAGEKKPRPLAGSG